MRVRFTTRAEEEYEYWRGENAKIFERITRLINAVRESPFSGIGKPEPLKDGLHGWWARRIRESDRLVYRVSGKGDAQTLEIASCRFHY